MPVKIGDKTYEDHDAAVKAIKESKPGIKNPDAYIATIERAEKAAKNDAMKGIKNYQEKHPFDKLEPGDKLEILRKIHGVKYNPPYINPKHEDLDLETRTHLDRVFNSERIAIISEKLQRLAAGKYSCPDCGDKFNSSTSLQNHKEIKHGTEPLTDDTNYQRDLKSTYQSTRGASEGAFSGKPGATPKKTGADVEKPKESNPKNNAQPFSLDLGAKLRFAVRQAVMSEFSFSKTNVKETLGKGDPENDPLKDNKGPKVPAADDTEAFNNLGAKIQRLAGTIPIKNGKPCPECTGKGEDYIANCPTCEGTGKQMFPYSK